MLFGNPHGIVQIWIIAAQEDGFFDVFFYYIGSFQGLGRSRFVSMYQTWNTQQCTAEIAHDNNQYISQTERINLPQYRPSCAAGRFSIIIGTKLQAVCTEAVGITPMPCLMVCLSLIIYQFFYIFGSTYRVGVGNKTAALIFKFSFSRCGQGTKSISHIQTAFLAMKTVLHTADNKPSIFLKRILKLHIKHAFFTPFQP